jgi:transposase
MKNKYACNSKLSECKIRQLLKYFADDIDATRASHLLAVSRVTVNRYYMAIRETILFFAARAYFGCGEVEMDESYFGSRHFGDKRGRGAPGKKIVFGILNRDGKVYAEIVPGVGRKDLYPIIEQLVSKDVVIHTDCWRTYSGLSKKGYEHRRVNHSVEYANDTTHINGIESFWSYCKRRFARLNGVANKYFSLHLRECEWRFNFRGCGWKHIYNELLWLLRENPLFSKVSGTLFKVWNVCSFFAARERQPPLEAQPEASRPQRKRMLVPEFLRTSDKFRSFGFMVKRNVTSITQKLYNFSRGFS